MGVVLPHEPKQIAVERAAQALVGRDQNDRPLSDGAHLQQRMPEIEPPCRRLALDTIEQLHERPYLNGSLLRLAHLRRRNHLHGPGDLRRVADRSDPPTDVSGAFHGSSPVLLELIRGGLKLSRARVAYD